MTETLTKKLKKKKGFTLIELIIVIAIIAIIAAFAVPNFIKTQTNSKIDADINLGKAIAHEIETLEADGTITVGTAATYTLNIASNGSPTGNTATIPARIQADVKAGTLKLQTPAASAATALTISIDTAGAVTITANTNPAAQLYPTPATPFVK